MSGGGRNKTASKQQRAGGGPPAAAAASASAAAAAGAPSSSNEEDSRKRQKMIAPPVVAAAAAPENEAEEDCGICFESGFAFRGEVDSCRHNFCFSCISEWYKSSNACPHCKQRFKKISKRDVKSKAVVSTVKCIKRDFGTVSAQEQQQQANAAVSAVFAHNLHAIMSGFLPVPGLPPPMYYDDEYDEDDEDYDEDDEDYDEDYDEDGANDYFPFFLQSLGFHHHHNHDFYDDEDEFDEDEDGSICPECGLLEHDCDCHDYDDVDPEPALIQQGNGTVDQPFELVDSDEE